MDFSGLAQAQLALVLSQVLAVVLVLLAEGSLVDLLPVVGSLEVHDLPLATSVGDLTTLPETVGCLCKCHRILWLISS